MGTFYASGTSKEPVRYEVRVRKLEYEEIIQLAQSYAQDGEDLAKYENDPCGCTRFEFYRRGSDVNRVAHHHCELHPPEEEMKIQWDSEHPGHLKVGGVSWAPKEWSRAVEQASVTHESYSRGLMTHGGEVVKLCPCTSTTCKVSNFIKAQNSETVRLMLSQNPPKVVSSLVRTPNLVGVEVIGYEDEEEHQEAWVCVCKNTPHTNGFFPCSSSGVEVTPDDAWGSCPLYCCESCGRIIHQHSRIVVGKVHVE